jgi:hypothetical protein
LWLLAGGILHAVHPFSAHALRMEGYLRSNLYLREDRQIDPYEEYFLPVRQYMTLHLSDFAGPEWSFHGSGWARQDLAAESDYAYCASDGRFDSELLTGYFQWQDLRQPNTYMRIGRQYLFWGGIYERFDGLAWSKQFCNGHGIALFGGIPSFSDYGSTTNDRVWGGRGWIRPWEAAELGLSYVRKTDEGDLDRETVTQDFFWRPLYWVELSEHVTQDLITEDIVDAGLFAALKFRSDAKFTVRYDERIPGLLLPQTSILSVFSNDTIKELAAGLEYSLDRDWRLWGEAIRYESDSPGGSNPDYKVDVQPYWEYRAGARYYYGDDSSLSIDVRHLERPAQGIPYMVDETRYETINNAFDRIRLTDHHWFNPWWWSSGELAATLYRDPVNGSDSSFSFSETLGYRPTKRVEAVATLRYEDSAVDNAEFQALFSVTYWWNKRICGGQSQDLLGDPKGYGGRWLPHSELPVPAVYRRPQ